MNYNRPYIKKQGIKMKNNKSKIMFSIILLMITACNKTPPTELIKTPVTPIEKSGHITNQFFLKSGNSSTYVLITEIKGVSGKECVISQSNYEYDESVATITCSNSPVLKVEEDKSQTANQIISQFEYTIPKTTNKVLVTEFYTHKNKVCIIVQANYQYDSSQTDISCDT